MARWVELSNGDRFAFVIDKGAKDGAVVRLEDWGACDSYGAADAGAAGAGAAGAGAAAPG